MSKELPLRPLMLAAAALAAACASAAPEAPPPQFTVSQANASVAAADLRVRSWGRDDSVLVQTVSGQWYRGVLRGGCTEKGFGAIGFETDSGDIIDRGSDVLVAGQSCPLASFDRIEPPPPGARR